MKILHILKREPSDTEKKIIDVHSKSNKVSIVRLYEEGGFTYDDLIKKIGESEKVFCW